MGGVESVREIRHKKINAISKGRAVPPYFHNYCLRLMFIIGLIDSFCRYSCSRSSVCFHSVEPKVE